MTRGNKTALKHAANAISGRRGTQPDLGATATTDTTSATDRKGRPYASTYLARRAGYLPVSQSGAQLAIVSHYGLSPTQATKLDRVAASTHNVRQRGARVATFLRAVAENPTYVGRPSRTSTGAVARSL